jgi:hypothetical protein
MEWTGEFDQEDEEGLEEEEDDAFSIFEPHERPVWCNLRRSQSSSSSMSSSSS